jgi:FkbM family methyltransferase
MTETNAESSLSPHTGAFKRVNGYLWPKDDRHAHPMIFATVRDALNAIELCKERNTVIQAGGNCGVWPNYLSDYFHEVWTIEADLTSYRALVQNAKHGDIFPIWAALGAEPGRAHAQTDKTNIGATRCILEAGRTPVITIDELELEDCDLICLDIEGMEHLALQGAAETIKRCKPVLMIEDKGLSEHYGTPKGWTRDIPGYRIVKEVHRDVILVPDDA